MNTLWGIFKSLFRLSFWFNQTPPPLVPWADYAILTVVSLIFLAGIGGFFYLRGHKVEPKDVRLVWVRVATLLVWAGVVGLILYVLTWQQVPVLGMRFFFLAWFLGFGWWGFTIGRYVKIMLPKERKANAEREAYEKWLPKPKH